MKVLLYRDISPVQIEQLRSRHPHLEVFKSIDAASLAGQLEDAEVVYGNVPPALVERAPKLRWIQLVSSGFDSHIGADRAGLVITTAHGIHAVPMAEHVLMGMLVFARNFDTYHRQQAARVWDRKVHAPFLLAGQTAGLVGYGAVGQALAPRLRAMGLTVNALKQAPAARGQREKETMNINPEKLTRLAAAVAGLTFLALSPPMRADLAPDYRQAWADVRQRIDDGIERNRKGDAAVEVVDGAGRAVAGAELDIREKTHEFLFGCNAFRLGEFDSAEKNDKYEKAFARLFNFATVPFYWSGIEPAVGYVEWTFPLRQPSPAFLTTTEVWRGEPRYAEGSRKIPGRPPPDRFVPFAKKYGITLKGHPLLWHLYNPAWLPTDPAELKKLYQARFKEIAERYSGDVKVWEVVNESLSCPEDFPLWTPRRDYVGWAFHEAGRVFRPDNVLMINETSTICHAGIGVQNPYYRQIDQLLGQGVGVEGIGFQFHLFHGSLPGQILRPAQLLDIYESFQKFHRPLYITEITIPQKPRAEDGLDRVGPTGEKSHQAEVIFDLYRLWFSVPAMAGITYWNLADGTGSTLAAPYQGGLLDANLNPKPAYQALESLINGEWTTALSARTDDAGKARFRGFYGKYVIKVTSGNLIQEFEVNLSKGGDAVHKLALKS